MLYKSSSKIMREGMERAGRFFNGRHCYLLSITLIFWWFLLCFYFMVFMVPQEKVSPLAYTSSQNSLSVPSFQTHELLQVSPSPFPQQKLPIFSPETKHLWQPLKKFGAKNDICAGKYVFMHDIPRQFNQEILDNCQNLSLWTNMCKYTANAGLGLPLEDSEGAFSKNGWFATHQYSMEVIFHNRMKQYPCLTSDSSKAIAFFVPFYSGLDISRHLWGANATVRDSAALALVDWLQSRPEWRIMGGRDHFMVSGRVTWDFRRKTQGEWGSKLLLIPAVKNMTTVLVEASPWHQNDFAIPYPTYFHPSQDSEVLQWQQRMRISNRTALFSFAGAPRPEIKTSIRSQIIEQCRQSIHCKLLECDFGESKCHVPSVVMKLFEESVFCLQPQGDSFTRRSVFDSVLAGCIPVLFHRHTAYSQYNWHLPANYSRYSVYISEEDIRSRNISIESVLLKISPLNVLSMREEVIKLIPGIIYANPQSQLQALKDAFHVTVQAVVDRITDIRMNMLQGRQFEEIDESDDNVRMMTDSEPSLSDGGSKAPRRRETLEARS